MSMVLDLDTAIFVGFLAINLAVGLFYSRGVKTTADYAIGGRNFTTKSITTTVVATYIGAGVVSSALNESYRQGLYFIVPALAEPLSLAIVGYFLIPRMVEFFGNLSVAETMGNIYGKPVRVAVAITSVVYSVGIVALQLKVAASVMQLFFGISSFYIMALSAIIVILYSSFGGIRSVTFTDILQFCTFGTIVPIICISLWKTMPLDVP